MAGIATAPPGGLPEIGSLAARALHDRRGPMDTIGDYVVRERERIGSIVRYEATHVVLPRRAIVEVLAPDAPRVDAMWLMRRACILEALQHPAVPRVFECGRLHGRPWVALAHDDGPTLADELESRRLEVREALSLLEEVAAILAHAHTRGVLHGNITPAAILRAPTLKLQRWDNARVHDTELSSDVLDGHEDVFALGKVIAAALARPHAVPEAVTTLLGRMLAADPALRPTASEVVVAAHALRDQLGPVDSTNLEALLSAFVNDEDDDEPEISIELAPAEDYILLDRRRAPSETVIVDLDAALSA